MKTIFPEVGNVVEWDEGVWIVSHVCVTTPVSYIQMVSLTQPETTWTVWQEEHVKVLAPTVKEMVLKYYQMEILPELQEKAKRKEG